MSFILDAIAKSEQERQQQEMPNVRMLTLPAAHARQRRRFLPFFVAFALLLNAIVMAIWMQSDREIPDQASSVKPGNTELEIERDAGADIAKPANPAKPDEATADAAIPAESPQAGKPALVNEALAGQQIVTRTDTGGTSDTGGTATRPVAEPETVRPEPVAMAVDSNTAARAGSDPDTSSSKTQTVAKVEPEVMQAPVEEPRKVSSLSELPSDVRRDLPSVTFSGHLYSEKPGVGVVFVDGGRPIKEGRRIVDELTLYKITPTGVILEFRGYLIEVGILQNWSLR